PHPVRMITDQRALDLLLSEAPSDGGLRRITKKGVRVNRVNFIAAEMAGHEDKTVRVLLDAADLGTIYLFDAETGEFICTAVDPIRTGHDRSEIAARGRALQNEFYRQGRKELKKIARESATDQIHTEILEYREDQIANIIELPQKTEEYTTDALQQAAHAVRDRERCHNDQADMEALLEDLAAEREAESREVKKKKDSGIVPLFASMTERYQWIKDRARDGKKLSQDEVGFLDEFYQTTAGRMYLDLEGDLRDGSSGSNVQTV
ncbi:Mu transposase C-terminal domain-containing protein, partial [Thermodesulfobacteriota bacterium]